MTQIKEKIKGKKGLSNQSSHQVINQLNHLSNKKGPKSLSKEEK